MPGALSMLRVYAPRVYPVRGVCIDDSVADVPQDVQMSSDKLKPGALAETNPPPPNIAVNTLSKCGADRRGYDRTRSLFSFFLDGTRRTNLVAEMETSSKRLLPIVAGQVSAAVLRRDRERGSVSTFMHRSRRLMLLPGGGGGLNADDAQRLGRDLTGHGHIEVGSYRCKKDGDPKDWAIAKINAAMQELEVQALEKLANEHLIGQDSMLVIDGSVQFQNIKAENLPWLRYAVGVAKSFNTHVSFVRDGTEIGAQLVQLNSLGDRTAAFRYRVDELHQYAVWYLRIREPRHLDLPLSGIVKVEKLLVTTDEREQGLASDAVDNVSLSLIGERYVSPYGRDGRWANHLYPIYLAERLQKSRQLSDVHFLRLF